MAWLNNPNSRVPDLRANTPPSPYPVVDKFHHKHFPTLIVLRFRTSLYLVQLWLLNHVHPVFCVPSVLHPYHVFIPSDHLHTMCSVQTIKVPMSCMYLQSEYWIRLCLVLPTWLSWALSHSASIPSQSHPHIHTCTTQPKYPRIRDPRYIQDTWITIGGRCSAWAEANIQNPSTWPEILSYSQVVQCSHCVTEPDILIMTPAYVTPLSTVNFQKEVSWGHSVTLGVSICG